MADIELYSYGACPFAQRTRMVLIEKNLDFDLTEIDMRNKPDWFLEISPYGKVPCLRHEGHVIYESSIINEYLEEVFPEISLLPSDPFKRAQARIWMHYCDSYYIATSSRIGRFHNDPEKQKEAISDLKDAFLFLENEGMRKISDGPFWFGSEVSMVDIQYSPFLERFAAYKEIWGVSLPDDCSRLRDWLEAMKTTKGFQETASPVDAHVNAIKTRLKRVAA